MNPTLQQRYAQMQRMQAQPNADAQAFENFNRVGGSVFNPLASKQSDNNYNGVDLSGYRNDENKNMSDKDLWNSIRTTVNQDAIRQGAQDAMGGSMVDQFNAMNPQMNTAGSIGPLNQAANNNFGYDPNQLMNNLGWKPNKMGVTKYGL